jgi:hypothetical protein
VHDRLGEHTIQDLLRRALQLSPSDVQSLGIELVVLHIEQLSAAKWGVMTSCHVPAPDFPENIATKIDPSGAHADPRVAYGSDVSSKGGPFGSGNRRRPDAVRSATWDPSGDHEGVSLSPSSL